MSDKLTTGYVKAKQVASRLSDKLLNNPDTIKGKIPLPKIGKLLLAVVGAGTGGLIYVSKVIKAGQTE